MAILLAIRTNHPISLATHRSNRRQRLYLRSKISSPTCLPMPISHQILRVKISKLPITHPPSLLQRLATAQFRRPDHPSATRLSRQQLSPPWHIYTSKKGAPSYATLFTNSIISGMIYISMQSSASRVFDCKSNTFERKIQYHDR